MRAATYTGRAGTPDFGNSVQFGTGGSVVVTTGTQTVSRPSSPTTVQGFSGGIDAEPLSVTVDSTEKEVTVKYDTTEDDLNEMLVVLNADDDLTAELFYGTDGTSAPEAAFERPFEPVGGQGEDGENGVSPAALTEALVEIFNGTLNVQGNAIAAGSATWDFDTYDRYFVAARYGTVVELDKAALQGLTAGAAGSPLSAAQHIDVTGRALGQPAGSDELHLGKTATDGILVAADDNAAFDGVIKIWGAESGAAGDGGGGTTPSGDGVTEAQVDTKIGQHDESATAHESIRDALQDAIHDRITRDNAISGAVTQEIQDRTQGDQANAQALTDHEATPHGGGPVITSVSAYPITVPSLDALPSIPFTVRVGFTPGRIQVNDSMTLYFNGSLIQGSVAIPSSVIQNNVEFIFARTPNAGNVASLKAGGVSGQIQASVRVRRSGTTVEEAFFRIPIVPVPPAEAPCPMSWPLRSTRSFPPRPTATPTC